MNNAEVQNWVKFLKLVITSQSVLDYLARQGLPIQDQYKICEEFYKNS